MITQTLQDILPPDRSMMDRFKILKSKRLKTCAAPLPNKPKKTLLQEREERFQNYFPQRTQRQIKLFLYQTV